MSHIRVGLQFATSLLVCLLVTACTGSGRPDDVASNSSAVTATPYSTSSRAASTAVAAPKVSEVQISSAGVGIQGQAGNGHPKMGFGTIWFGCGDSTLPIDDEGSQAVIASGPSVFDTSQGKLVQVAVPTTPLGEEVVSAVCAVVPNGAGVSVVYFVDSVTPAKGLQPQQEHSRAYVVEVSSGSVVNTADFTATPLVDVTEAFGTNAGIIVETGSRSHFLTLPDLRLKWSRDYQPETVTPNAIVYGGGGAPGFQVEILNALGDQVLKEEGSLLNSVDELGSGAVVRIVDWNIGGIYKYFEMRTNTCIDAQLVAAEGSNTRFALEGDHLFINGDSIRLVNLATGQVELNRTLEETSNLNATTFYFPGNVYVVTASSPATSSVTDVSSSKIVSEEWNHRPVTHLSGWTLVYSVSPEGNDFVQGSNAQICRLGQNLGACDISMVADVDGQYPGPHF